MLNPTRATLPIYGARAERDAPARNSVAFDAAFHVSVYGVSLVSFAALAHTGELSPTATLIGFLAFAIVPFRSWIGGGAQHAGAWTLISFVAFSVCFYYSLAAEILGGIVYFFIYIQFQRLMVGRRNREFLQLIAVSFFQMVGAANMMLGLAFGGFFVAYLLFASASLALLTCRYDRTLADGAQLGQIEKTRTESPTAGYRLATRPALNSFVWMLGGLLFSTFILFLYIPRLSATNFFFNYRRTAAERLPGFSDTIEFGDFEPVKMNPRTVARVKMHGREIPEFIRLRGLTLSSFDGQRWTRHRSGRERTYTSTDYQGFESEILQWPRRLQRVGDLSLRTRNYSAEIQIEPGGTEYMLVPEIPHRLGVPLGLPLVVDSMAGTVRMIGVPRTKLDYHAEWREWQVDWENILEVSGKVRVDSAEQKERMLLYREVHDVYTQLPDGIRRHRDLRDLANGLVEDRGFSVDKARAIEQHFRSGFQYSLESSTSDPSHYVEEFLFENKSGHCEHFATSMAVLCRLVDIPARVVVGFYSDEYSDIGGYFIVRQEHAHSWVEVFDEGLGWVSFDPTPSTGVGAERLDKNPYIRRLNYFIDALKTKWYRYVVDYSHIEQRNVYGQTLGRLRSASRSLGGGELASRRSSFLIAAAFALVGGVALLWYARSRRASRHVVLGRLNRLWTAIRADVCLVLSVRRSPVAVAPRYLQRQAAIAGYRPDDLARAVHLYEIAIFAGRDLLEADVEWLGQLAGEIRAERRALLSSRLFSRIPWRLGR